MSDSVAKGNRVLVFRARPEPDHFSCSACGQAMLVSAGCTLVAFTIEGAMYERVPFGCEDRVDPFLAGCYDDLDQPLTRCGDCATPAGRMHHWGCDIERCPHCGEQALSCDAFQRAGESQAAPDSDEDFDRDAYHYALGERAGLEFALGLLLSKGPMTIAAEIARRITPIRARIERWRAWHNLP